MKKTRYRVGAGRSTAKCGSLLKCSAMNPPLKVGAMLSSNGYDIDSIKDDLPVVRGILESYAPKASEEAGVPLPDSWSVDVTVRTVVDSMWTDERVLRLEGVVIPT